jgi:hypothetical protein
MRDWLDNSRDRRESVTPVIRVAIALSILIHIAAMWRLPQVRLSPPETPERSDTNRPLSVHLAPPVPPPPRAPSVAQRAKPPAAVRARPKAAPRPRATPPVIAREQPAEPPSVAAPPPVRRPAGDDLSSYIEAKRRARDEAARPPPAPQSTAAKAAPPEDENARTERIVAANLTPPHTMAFGYDPTQRGGIFHIEHISDDAAEFIFYGWHKAMRRNMAQLIEVRKGGNPDIRIAVIRRMIAIIRDYEQADFLWESRRLGRNVTLSARTRDNAGLEDFLMAEFFGDPRPSQ